MSDIKAGLGQISSGRGVVRTSPTAVPHTRLPRTQARPVELNTDNNLRHSSVVSNSDVVSAFTEPSNETRLWLGSTMLTPALKAVSEDVAPQGSAKSSRDQYVASVVETHLAARKQLATHLNALLRA